MHINAPVEQLSTEMLMKEGDTYQNDVKGRARRECPHGVRFESRSPEGRQLTTDGATFSFPACKRSPMLF
jgi:hypothetical protein